jgi:hypothetical protein
MEENEQTDERTIEEHAKQQRVAPSILAAVMQAEQWAVGKTVTETAFKDAVNRFLSAPMGRY